MKTLFFIIALTICSMSMHAQTLLATAILNNSTVPGCDVAVSMKAQVISGPSANAPCSMSIPVNVANGTGVVLTLGDLITAGYTFVAGDVVQYQVAEFQVYNCNVTCTPFNGSIGNNVFCGGVPNFWTNGCQNANYLAFGAFQIYTW